MPKVKIPKTPLTGFLIAGLLVSFLFPGAAAGGGAYDDMDPERLGKALRDLHMSELLDTLVGQLAGSDDVRKLSLFVQAKIDAATRAAADVDRRNGLLDEAIAVQDRLIRATASAIDDKGVLRHYRFRLDRIVTEGITKSDPYVTNLLYFQGSDDDAAVVAELTGRVIVPVGRLVTEMRMKREDWTGDEERLITGSIWKLDALIGEARYQSAWIYLYRGMVLPKGSQERQTLLRRAIAAVKDFADASDDSSGLKFTSLMLSGMCSRFLGQWDDAMSLLKRAADARAGAKTQLKALFETVVCLIDQGKFEEAGRAIERFAKRGADLKIAAVALDIQSALLRVHLLEARAEAVRKTDAASADALLDESRKVLLAFVRKYPDYRGAFVEIIAAKYKGRDTTDVSPDIKILLGMRQFNKALREAPDGRVPDLAEARKIFTAVLADDRSDDASRITALWYLGLTGNLQRRNYEAAEYFRQLAEKFPADSRAKEAALNAVRSFQGIIDQKKATPAQLGTEFVKQYARSLEVLVKNWGQKDAEVRSYNYELGMMYEILGRYSQAIEAFNKLGADSARYIPSRFRVLSLRVDMLLESSGPSDRPAMTRRIAEDLIEDLRAYSRRAREYAAADPSKASQVRDWGARCDLLVSRIMKDVLDQPARSIAQARKAARDWPDVPGIGRQSRQFVIRVLLETGQTEEAVENLLKLLGEEDSTGAEALTVTAVEQIRARIGRLEYRTDAKSVKKLAGLRKAYRIFAEKLFQWGLKAGLPDERTYGFRQALAGAYESSDKAQELARAKRLYEQLAKENPADPVNVLGLARCYRQAGDNSEAMKQYDRLIDNLPARSALWWPVQLERLQFATKMFAGDADGLNSVRLQIRLLRDDDAKMGGFRELFDALERRVGG